MLNSFRCLTVSLKWHHRDAVDISSSTELKLFRLRKVSNVLCFLLQVTAIQISFPLQVRASPSDKHKTHKAFFQWKLLRGGMARIIFPSVFVSLSLALVSHLIWLSIPAMYRQLFWTDVYIIFWIWPHIVHRYKSSKVTGWLIFRDVNNFLLERTLQHLWKAPAKVLFGYVRGFLWVKLKPAGAKITELSFPPFFLMCSICILLSLAKEIACSEKTLSTMHIRKKERENDRIKEVKKNTDRLTERKWEIISTLLSIFPM